MTRARERTADRRVTAAGLWVAGGFLLLSIGSVALPSQDRLGAWLPLHLALAGGASQAIGAVLPFFTAALLGGRPAPLQLRAAVLVLLGAGALAISLGVAGGVQVLAATGGVSFVGGIGLLAFAAFLPLRGAVGSRHPWVLLAYGAALTDVAIGASLGSLEVGGFGPVAADWAWLKPTHAWLNLLGFVSLVVAGTLLHLYPTVVGSRIAGGVQRRVMVAGLAGGALLVALAYLVRSDVVGRVGAVVELAGALGLVAYVASAWRARGRWTGNRSWRAVAIGSLGAGVIWFAVAVAAATGRVLLKGVTPQAWSLEVVGPAIAVGWVVQSLVGAWTHLLPAISGGSPRRHERQRDILGTAAMPRVIAMNGGVVLLAVGLAGSNSVSTVAGVGLVAAALLVGLVLLLEATAVREP